MLLKTLLLRNFRNYSHLEVSFGPEWNILVGDNAQGKTNLLEAISILSTGRSFRTTQLKDLIQEGKDNFFIEAKLIKDDISQSLQLYFDGKVRKLTYNRTSYNTFQPLFGILPSVFFTTRDVQLILGSPSHRRRFLNLYLAQKDPLYVHHWTRYWKAMQHRNALLKKNMEDSIEVFEQQMASSASYIMEKREKMIDHLRNPFLKFYGKLNTDQEIVDLRYQSSLSRKDVLGQFQNLRKKEMIFGSTLIGPHRDDLSFLIGNKTSKIFASEGQIRSIIAALRLSERESLTEEMKTPVVIGIDDLGVHLDFRRQELLTKALSSLSQVFVTLPKLPGFIKKGKVFQVEKGNLITI